MWFSAGLWLVNLRERSLQTTLGSIRRCLRWLGSSRQVSEWKLIDFYITLWSIQVILCSYLCDDGYQKHDQSKCNPHYIHLIDELFHFRLKEVRLEGVWPDHWEHDLRADTVLKHNDVRGPPIRPDWISREADGEDSAGIRKYHFLHIVQVLLERFHCSISWVKVWGKTIASYVNELPCEIVALISLIGSFELLPCVGIS